MFERILVPLDGSEIAATVLSQVRQILLHKDAEVLLVRAVALPPGAEGDTVELEAIVQAQASRYLEKIAGALISQGARVRTFTRGGNAAEAILDVAAEEKATLIALSTHGRSGIARWALGSVAEKVLHASRIPVLVLQSFSGAEEGAARHSAVDLAVKRILIPLDDSDLSKEILAPALELAKLFGAHVVLLHVCDGPECTVPVPQMSSAFDTFRAAGLSVEPLMKMGDPAREILNTCSEQKADLIAMTTHARSGISRWMLGSVTERVLRASAVPLLVVRPVKAT